VSVYGTSVVKRLSKAQARELDHHMLVIAEQRETNQRTRDVLHGDGRRSENETLQLRRHGMNPGERILEIFAPET
jgi:hypothetical protein